MPGPSEELFVDLDVSGDDIPEGLTFAFQDDDFVVEGESLPPSQDDEDRSAYIEDVFQGSTDTVTPWKSTPLFCTRIDVNGAESRLLDSMKRSIEPTMTTCSRLSAKPIESFNPSVFASIYLNRDWYILLFDHINFRIEDPEQKSTMPEILEMQRVWMLQCIYNTTARNLFQDGSRWFLPVRRLLISYERYSFLFKQLEADLPPINVHVGLNDLEEDANAELVWGSFNQHNDAVSKLEAHVGNVGRNFLREKLSDVTIDDDKLRHTSKTFSDHGLRRTGFRGSRCGPVMNAAGSVQSGLIFSIHFSRIGDSTLAIVKTLLRHLGYGQDSGLKHRLDVVMMVDRGYHVSSVIKLFLTLGCQVLGTHSEHAGKWPYCSGENPKSWQTNVSTDGARTVLYSTRKINNVQYVALCYRNGNKGVVMLHTTLEYAGVW
jgi:hypothetical protein